MTNSSKARAGRRFLLPTRGLTVSGSTTLLLSAGVLWLFFSAQERAMLAIRRALILSAETLIPSLFPFMVLSGLIVSLGPLQSLGRPLERLMRRLFGLPGNGALPVLVGIVCGFPIGAEMTAALYREGLLSTRECERLTALATAPSLAFLLSTVGGGLFGSLDFGIVLFFAVLLANLLSAQLFRGNTDGDEARTAVRDIPRTEVRFASAFTGAVKGASHSMLTVVAFVVFFALLAEATTVLLFRLGAPEQLSLLLSGLLEISGGCQLAATAVNHSVGRVIAAFFCGFGGLSANLQVISVYERTDTPPIGFRRYFLWKLSTALLAALIVLLAGLIFPAL